MFPLWLQIAGAVAAAVWPAGLYIGHKLGKIDELFKAELPTRVIVLETKVEPLVDAHNSRMSQGGE